MLDYTKLTATQMNRISVQEFKQTDKTPFVIVLDNIRSMNNIGAIFRTADAFRLQKIYLCGITATPPHREINKTALGATQSVDWQYFDNTIECINFLKQNNYTICSLEQTANSTMLHEIIVPKVPIAIIVGNEVDGVQQEVVNMSDKIIEIPQFGTKHSLNVSVSCGICIWDLFKQYNYSK